MPRAKISEFSTIPGDNTDIDGINIAEGCAPSGINDAIRELMAQLKDFQSGAAGDNITVVGTLAAKGTSASGADLKLYEDTDNGTNYVGFIAPASIASNVQWTLPSADGSSGQALQTNGSGTLSFATLGISAGGTGQTTANAAFNALAPSQTGNSGRYLTTDGTNTSWGVNPLGTVTSVAMSVPSFLSVSGSPITSSGTLAVSLSGTALPTANGGTGLTSFTANGVVYASSTSALTTGSALVFDGSNLGLGVTPSAWGGSFRSYDVGAYGSFWNTSGGTIGMAYNAYHNGTNFIYKASSIAPANYQQSLGAHQWFTAPSGTAGNTISFTQAMTLDASGRLQIGTTTAAGMLTVSAPATTTYGTLNAASDGFGYLTLRNNGTDCGYVGPGALGGGNQLGLASAGATPIVFGTNGSERARITSGGQLQLTTNGANQTFTSGGELAIKNSSSDPFISFHESTGARIGFFQMQSSGNANLWVTANQPLVFATNGSERARITSGGNLYLGITTDPPTSGARLIVDHTGSNTALLLNTGTSAGVSGIQFRNSNSNGEARLTNNTGGALTFYNGATTEAARITSGGQLLINSTTDGAAAGGRLHITGNTLQSAASVRIGTDGYPGWYFVNASGTKVGDIVINNASTTYNTSSDYRLKNITGPVANSGAYIDSLKPVEGTWKSNGKTFVGLIAHEAQEVSRTEVATGTKDGEEMQGMDYGNSEFIANIIAELQSLRARVAALESK